VDYLIHAMVKVRPLAKCFIIFSFGFRQ